MAKKLYFTIFRYVRKTAKCDYSLRHVCSSVCPHGTTQHRLERLSFILLNILRKFRLHQNMTRITATLLVDQYTFLIISRSFRHKMFQTKFVDKIRTHISCFIPFFLNLAVYEIIWNNPAKNGRPQMTIWRLGIAAGYLSLQVHT